MILKKNITLIVLLIICAALFATYFIISSLPEKDKSDPTDDAYLYVDQNNIDDVTGFSFVGGEFDLAFGKDENGNWKYLKNPTLPVNSSFLEETLASAELILATKQISSSASEKDLSEYGLDTPSYTLTINIGKTEKSYLFGDFIESKGLYYMMEEGSHSIYLTESLYVEGFSLEVFDLLATDTLTKIGESDVVSVEIVCGAYRETFYADNEENSDISKLISSLCSMEITRCVDFGSETFDIYGLAENEAVTVYIALSDKKLSYKFGLGETEEFIYLLTQNASGEFSEMVYLFSSSSFEHLYKYLSDAYSENN